MNIEIKKDLNGSILDIGGGGEAVIGKIYRDKVTAVDNRPEELDAVPDCCAKQRMDAAELLFPDGSFDNVTFFYTLMYMTEETQRGAIREAARVLRSGGFISVWDCDIGSAYPEPFLVDLDINAAGNMIRTTYGIVKKDTQSSGSIIHLLEQEGLRIDSLQEEGGQFRIRCVKQ